VYQQTRNSKTLALQTERDPVVGWHTASQGTGLAVILARTYQHMCHSWLAEEAANLRTVPSARWRNEIENQRAATRGNSVVRAVLFNGAEWRPAPLAKVDFRKAAPENITCHLVLIFLEKNVYDWRHHRNRSSRLRMRIIKIILLRYNCWKYGAQVLGPGKLSWGRGEMTGGTSHPPTSNK